MNFLWHGRVSFFFLDTTVLTLEGQQQQSSPSFKFLGSRMDLQQDYSFLS